MCATSRAHGTGAACVARRAERPAAASTAHPSGWRSNGAAGRPQRLAYLAGAGEAGMALVAGISSVAGMSLAGSASATVGRGLGLSDRVWR